MKKHVVACVVVVSIILLVLICGPILINESYKANEGYITEWGAADVLAYFASALSFVGTTFVSIIALYLTHKYEKDSKKREDRLLAINVPPVK